MNQQIEQQISLPLRQPRRQQAIPCTLMRGGTSKGPFFRLEDLPSDPTLRDKVLLRLMGSPDAKQIDGIGGATTVTSKVALVSVSQHPEADIDYLFAQVDIEKAIVDWGPTCGNMLAAVGPFALEENLVASNGEVSTLVIRNVNTESLITASIQTPQGSVEYEGDYGIAGVPGTAAPIRLDFHQIMGSKTGKLLPTGSVRDEFDGVEVTCIDVAMPMVIIAAHSLGKTAAEGKAELEGDRVFMQRLERIRLQAGEAMGFGNVSGSVIPKIAILGPPRHTGQLSGRYFTPLDLHPSYAVSGAICSASCAAMPGSVLDGLGQKDADDPQHIGIEHPSGVIDVKLKTECHQGRFSVVSGGVYRTARKLFKGEVFIPRVC